MKQINDETKELIIKHLSDMEDIIKKLKTITQEAEDSINSVEIQSHLFEIEHEIVGLEVLVEGDKNKETIKDYSDICPTCYHFGTDGTCDMCAWGHPTAEDNNGLTPQEVKRCDYK